MVKGHFAATYFRKNSFYVQFSVNMGNTFAAINIQNCLHQQTSWKISLTKMYWFPVDIGAARLSTPSVGVYRQRDKTIQVTYILHLLQHCQHPTSSVITGISHRYAAPITGAYLWISPYLVHTTTTMTTDTQHHTTTRHTAPAYQIYMDIYNKILQILLWQIF